MVIQTSKLLNRMQFFVQNFNSYVSYQVIRNNWKLFEEVATHAQTIDEFLDGHKNFLDSVLTQSLLSLPDSLAVSL